MKLFRDEVYERLGKSRTYNGIDEALRLIWEDKKLHDTLRMFAQNNGIISYVPGRPGHGCLGLGTWIEKSIVLFSLPAKEGSGFRPLSLKICPDAKAQRMPIFFYHMMRRSSQDCCGDYFSYTAEEVIPVEMGPDGFFYLTRGEFKGRLVASGFFEGVAAKEILENLEKELARILGEGEEQ